MADKKTTAKSVMAYQMIRDGIMEGRYLPGAHLVVANLQGELGLRQGPIREALMRLDSSGLVKNTPYKGAVVKNLPSFDEMAVIYEMRIVVEQELAVAALRKITQTQLNKLEKIIEVSQRDIDKSHKFYQHDRLFHTTLYTIADMSHLIDIMIRLAEHADIFLNTHEYELTYRQQSIEHHRCIVTALKHKDKEKVCKYLKENIQLGFSYISNYLRKP